MMTEKQSGSGGIGFVGLLTIAFVVLKLCGTIDWSWWWVLSPIWITASIIGCIVLVAVAVMFVIEMRRK